MRQIGIVPPDGNLVAVWPDVGELLQKHGGSWLKENELINEDVFVRLVTGQWELWLATDGIELDGLVLTQLRGRELWVVWACGQHVEKYMLDGLQRLEQFALMNGAREVVVGGRPGWDRVLEKLKYVRVGEWLRKDLVKAYAN